MSNRDDSRSDQSSADPESAACAYAALCDPVAAALPASPTPGAEQQRRGRGPRRGGQRGARGHLIGGHRGGGLHPHPDVVGLVERDRNGVDAEEVRAQQNRVNGVVGGQLGSVGIVATAAV